MKKLFLNIFLWSMMFLQVNAYTLVTKDIYVPIMMDDITIMISLRPSEVVSPSNGATIDGTLHLKFSKGSGVEKRLLKVYYSNHTRQAVSTWITSDSYTVSLPKDGKYIDVELRSYIGEKYFVKKYRFKQSVNPSQIVTPVRGSILSGSMATFRWQKGTSVTEQYLMIGTGGYGSKNIYKGYVNNATSKTLYNLPRNGETVYIILMSNINGKWYSKYYSYKATDVEVIAKNFVRDYIRNNPITLKRMMYEDGLQALKNIDSKVKHAFRNIIAYSYEKSVYFHNYKASVVVRSKISSRQTVELKFIFTWVLNRWVLERVI